jgi:transcriptional regulator with XRE-family HTH domain
MDRPQLADFLRRRRAALQPEDVGLARGQRRRTKGLRREEVATLASMSTDYYSRLEQRRGPQPSEHMLAAIARGLRLTQDERDHLFRLAGHTAPARAQRSDHVSPALMHVLDRLDTPALVMSYLGHTLVQNPSAIALLGDQTVFKGPSRSIVYRWFTDPKERRIYPEADHPYHGRVYVAGLRSRLAKTGEDSSILELIELLRLHSEEFTSLWNEHEVAVRTSDRKRMVHPMVGSLELDCQILRAESQAQSLLVFTATPGTEDYDKLQLLSVIGTQQFKAPSLKTADNRN